MALANSSASALLTSAVEALTAGEGGASFLRALSPAALLDPAAAHPTTLTAQLTAALVAACYAGNVVTGYWSWVDRVWSLSPVVYAATYAALTRHPRALVMAACVAAWGARLTRNFARKGGYGPEEDYRWPILRRWIARVDPSGEHGVLAQLFSLGFVAAYQNLLIWAFVAPSFHASTAAPGVAPLGAADALLAALFLALLAGEHYTDEAQWAFQAAKARLSPAARAAAGGDLARGFCTAGPFAYSRHANFFCEQAMWWTVFAFAAAATRGGARGAAYAAVGPALLSALFQGSTWMTELVSVGKYPAYSAYQATTSMLVPWTPGASLDSPEGRALVRAAEAAAAAKKAKAKAAAA